MPKAISSSQTLAYVQDWRLPSLHCCISNLVANQPVYELKTATLSSTPWSPINSNTIAVMKSVRLGRPNVESPPFPQWEPQTTLLQKCLCRKDMTKHVIYGRQDVFCTKCWSDFPHFAVIRRQKHIARWWIGVKHLNSRKTFRLARKPKIWLKSWYVVPKRASKWQIFANIPSLTDWIGRICAIWHLPSSPDWIQPQIPVILTSLMNWIRNHRQRRRKWVHSTDRLIRTISTFWDIPTRVLMWFDRRLSMHSIPGVPSNHKYMFIYLLMMPTQRKHYNLGLKRFNKGLM